VPQSLTKGKTTFHTMDLVDYRKTIIIYTTTILVQQCNLAMSMPCDVMQSEREAE